MSGANRATRKRDESFFSRVKGGSRSRSDEETLFNREPNQAGSNEAKAEAIGKVISTVWPDGESNFVSVFALASECLIVTIRNAHE